MVKFSNSIQITINKQHRLGSHMKQPLLFSLVHLILCYTVYKKIMSYQYRKNIRLRYILNIVFLSVLMVSTSFGPVLMVSTSFGQELKYYHKFRTSDSHLVLTKWRVDPKEKGDNYIIETVDKHGRVTELRFIHNGVLLKGDCYNDAVIKFKYYKDKIIQFNYSNDSTLSAGIECGSPAKIIYYLQNNKITNCKYYLRYEVYLNGSFELEKNFRTKLEKEKEQNKNGIEGNCKYVWGYIYSSAKYEGYLPVSSKYDSSSTYLPYSVEAKNSEFSINYSKLLHDKS